MSNTSKGQNMHNHEGKGLGKWMWICIAAPIIALAILVLNRSGAISVGRYLPYAVFLLCPLSHFAMMGLMHKKPASEKAVVDGETKNDSDCH